MGVNAGTAVMSIIVATFLRIDLQRLNRKMDEAEFGSVSGSNGRREQSGETPQKSFRYLY